jgi:hypothetical protein
MIKSPGSCHFVRSGTAYGFAAWFSHMLLLNYGIVLAVSGSFGNYFGNATASASIIQNTKPCRLSLKVVSMQRLVAQC